MTCEMYWISGYKKRSYDILKHGILPYVSQTIVVHQRYWKGFSTNRPEWDWGACRIFSVFFYIKPKNVTLDFAQVPTNIIWFLIVLTTQCWQHVAIRIVNEIVPKSNVSIAYGDAYCIITGVSYRIVPKEYHSIPIMHMVGNSKLHL